jgi:voltage-gated potassium channel
MKRLNPTYRLFLGLLALIATIAVGIVGYYIIEGWSFLDSLYMTITTLSTVGFREVHELSIAGRIFTIILILGGVGTVFYLLTNIVAFFLEGEFGIRFGRRRMEAKINKLNNHYVICGFGRVGEAIANTLKNERTDFVVIDLRDDCFLRAQNANYLAILGDATKNEIMSQAMIEKARGVIVAFGDDAHNLYAIMTANELHPGITIITRASNADGAKRMVMAGAKHVIAPESLGGQQMARLAIRPSAVKFIETVLAGKEEEVIVEEINANEESQLIGLSIHEIELRFPRVKILAIKDEEGSILLNPEQATKIQKTHSLTAFGPLNQMQKLESCCQFNK